MKQRINPETHPTRLITVIDGVCASVHRLQKAAETAGLEELRELLGQTLEELQTTADCVAALTRRVARGR